MGVTVLTSRIIEENLLQTQVDEGMQQTSNLSVRVALDFSEKNASTLYNLALEQGRESSARVLLVNNMGVVQIDSFSRLNGAQLKVREVIEVLTGVKDASYGYHVITPENGASFWTVYYSAAILEDTQVIGAVVLAQSLQDVVTKTALVKTQYLLIFAACVIVILFVAYLSTNHISRPLEQLTQGARAIAAGNFDVRVPQQGNNEITQLSRAFNQMGERLENIDRHRREFVSNASHELKTPMTSMKILSESLLYQDGVSEEVYKEFLSDINQEIDRMNRLIDSLLLMTKIESEQEILEKGPADLSQLTRQTVKLLAPIAQAKQVQLHMEADEVIEVECDPLRIRQAINNLVENAIKYTAAGGSVQVSVYALGNFACVSVRDTGEGIPPEHLPHIFDRFYRVDKARARRTGGSGLGLHIVQRIANAHEGRVEVQSTPGVGSEFRLLLPLKRSRLLP